MGGCGGFGVVGSGEGISVASGFVVSSCGVGFVGWSMRGNIQSAGEGVISCDRGVVDSRSVTPFDGMGWLAVRVRGRIRRERKVVRWMRGVCIFAVVGSGFG